MPRLVDSTTTMLKLRAPRLTEAQERFARENDATPGGHASSNRSWIFMYHEEATASVRWLVGPDGEVLERRVFNY